MEAKTEEELQRDRREQKEMMIQQDLDRVMEVQKDLNRDMDKMQRDMEKMHGLTQQTLNDIQDRLPLKEAVRPPQLFEQIIAQLMPEPRLCLPFYSHCQWSTKLLNPNRLPPGRDTANGPDGP